MGVLVQNNSTFQAPFATFTLNHNTHAGLVLVSQGALSFGGSIVAKNNGMAGIFVDDGSSFSPFSNLVGGSTITLEDNGQAGISVMRGSVVELANVVVQQGLDLRRVRGRRRRCGSAAARFPTTRRRTCACSSAPGPRSSTAPTSAS